MIGDTEIEAIRPDSPAANPRDRFSTWSVILIAIVIAFQLFLNDGQALISAISPHHRPAPADSISTDEFGKLVTIDNAVKIAYVEDALPPEFSAALAAKISSRRAGGKVFESTNSHQNLSPFHQTIQEALDESVSALRINPDSTYFARRVMVLRMVMGQLPMAPIGASGKLIGLKSPLDAFENSAKEHVEASGYIRKEEKFWRDTFSADKMSRQQLPVSLKALNQYPTLLFYSLIARQQIFLRAGSFAEAKHIEKLLEDRALTSFLSIGGLSLLVMSLLLIGFCIWIGSISSIGSISLAQNDPYQPVTTNFFARFLVPVPKRIADEDRRLRAGDLMDCFAVYLVSLTGIGSVLGILASWVPRSTIDRLSVLQLTYLDIGLALISYVGASGIAYAFLKNKAKKLEASLQNELGLTRARLLVNLGYGAIGWGASLVLVFTIGFISSNLLHNLPSPENPVLPMLSFAPNTICRLSLYSLAAIAAPFFEETFFRGVLLNSLLLRLKPIWACLIVGAVFGGIHPVGIAEAFSLMALGAVFAWMAYLRKSLAPSMLAHFMQNSFAYLTVYLTFAVISGR